MKTQEEMERQTRLETIRLHTSLAWQEHYRQMRGHPNRPLPPEACRLAYRYRVRREKPACHYEANVYTHADVKQQAIQRAVDRHADKLGMAHD